MKKPHPKKHAHPPRPAAPRQNQTHWADVADWYDKLVGDEGSEYHQHVVLPGVFRMLGLKPDNKLENQKSKIENPVVLDLACGQGVLCRKLAESGCHVTGIDAAAPLIEAAQRREANDHLGIRYHVADATKLVDENNTLLAPVAPASQDAITLILAIQNMTPLSPVWQACRAMLKPGGVLITVMMHPCFRNPRQSDWLWEDRGSAGGGGVGEQVRTIKQYLTSSKVDIQTHPGLAAHGKSETTTPHFHRPLQAYSNTLGNAGLLIDHIEEWISHKTSQPGPKKAALDRARKEIPMFLALRARRL
ncbi:MAG: class I SAM-dependent methyltransferase [Phycisphaerae bacterium]